MIYPTKIVPVTVNKGGAGKTMLCRSIAVCAANAGFSVLILDMDTQQNSSNWRKRRDKDLYPLPLVKFVTENDLPDELALARQAECDLILIDTPPARGTEAAAAVEEADLVLIPCTPEVECFEAVPRTNRLIQKEGKIGYLVPNEINPSSKAEEDIVRGIAEAYKIPTSPIALHKYIVHREGALRGQTATELEPKSKAAEELEGLWKWLRAELQMITTAHVHKVAP